MDIFLDSNIWLTDIHLKSNRFANFFDFVRRTRSRVLLPAMVRDEVTNRHADKLAVHVSRVEKELKELRRYALDRVSFQAPYGKGETRSLKALLRKPSRGVRTHFLPTADDVDLDEVIRRGVERVPPASPSGEELRDVILWLLVLSHAKASSRPTAFVSADNGFWEGDRPKEQILSDIRVSEVDLRIYTDLAAFTKDNALISERVTDPWAESHVGANFDDLVAQAIRQTLKRGNRQVSGTIQSVTATKLVFEAGSLYKIDTKTSFAELSYRGFFNVETISVRYQMSLFDSVPQSQPPSFGGGSFAWPGANRMVPLSSLLNPGRENPETYRNRYNVEAEIRVSCRVQEERAETEIDEIVPVKVDLVSPI
jgi:PIN domain